MPVGPLKVNDEVLLAKSPPSSHRRMWPCYRISSRVRSSRTIRAQYGFRPLDSLHLAAAVEYGCTIFLTNNAQLKRFPDVVVEVLS